MQENLETTLAALVAIPSVSDDSFACQSIINFVHEELKAYDLYFDLHSDVKSPWLLATTQRTLTPDILFYAHLDVVPAPTDMFRMQKDTDGRLLGRGVFDMKFAAACYLEFLRHYKGNLADLNIGFLFITDEEWIDTSMDDVLATGLRPKVVFMPDGGDNWEIEKRAKGFHAATLTATGKAAHGSRPWEGTSALHNLLDALEPLRKKYMYRDKHYPTLMINGIKSGLAINQVPDHASAWLDFRCFNQEEMDEYLSLLNQIPKTNPTITLELFKSGKSILFDDTNPAVKEFLQVFREVRGQEPAFCDSYGASDARFLTPLNIPSIIVEPRGGGRHSPEEWIMADDLSLYYQLIERWILKSGETPIIHQQREKVLI